MKPYNECKAIVELDLDPIKVKLMHKESGEGWTAAQANAAETEYRRFLYLTKTHPEEAISPTVDVDTFWHYHILDTMKYAADCSAIFGYFLHHFPYVGMRGEDDVRAQHDMDLRTRALYAQAFGDESAAGAGKSFCSVTAQSDAAFCSVSAKAAFCSVTAGGSDKEKSFCSVTAAKPAFCSLAAKPSFCSVSAKPAFCPVAANRSFCSVTAKPSFCSVATKPAFCSVTARPAFCSVTAKSASSNTAPAFCSVTAKPSFCSVTAARSFCSVTQKEDFFSARPRFEEEALAA